MDLSSDGQFLILKRDICCIDLEELTSASELLKNYPCGCDAACVVHGVEWVASKGTCYQCRKQIVNSQAVSNIV